VGQKAKDTSQIGKLKKIVVFGEVLYYSLSFDIDDFFGDGMWWLQIYDSNKQIIYDEPIGGSRWEPNRKDIRETITVVLPP